jgi:hypothetical protein
MTRLSAALVASATLLLLVSPVAAAPPTIAFTAPTTAVEGDEIVIRVAVTDPDGDTPTWSWDLDADGTFGDLPDGTEHTVPAGTSDGPLNLRVGVQATDGVESRTTYLMVGITNVAPSITSAPGTTAYIRSEYRYEIAADDPGGAADPLTYRLTSRPMGMEITDNIITWTPSADQRGRSFPVIMRVDDGDTGEEAQMWDVMVSANRAPEAPTPASPIDRMRVAADEPVTLSVENGVDPDGDALDYFFRLSRTSSFDTASVIGSGGVAEDTGETTSWTTTEPLEPGLWYWQVWVDDGMTESPRRFAQLVVGDGTIVPTDAGSSGLTDGGRIPGVDAGTGGGGGCSVGSTSPARRGLGAVGSLMLALAGMWLALRRRRVGR